MACYKGTAQDHDLIAFDTIVDDVTKDTEVFVMNPDGTGVTCVTCNDTVIPKGFIGQPEWHPDGLHLVIQAEHGNSGHTPFNHLSWGIDQDLWIIKTAGTGTEKIVDNSAPARDNHAALHPHFNEDGTKLIFS